MSNEQRSAEGAAGRGARCLLSLDDIDDDTLERIVRRGAERRLDVRALDGLVVGLFFTATSTRTRLAFGSAAARLGAAVLDLGADRLQLKTGETLADTAEVFSSMLDGLVMRNAGDPEELRTLAAPGSMAVINAMSSDEHPTQAIADLSTIHWQFGSVRGVRVLYAGEGNNTATALARGLPRFAGTSLHVRTPRGYGIDAVTEERAAKLAAASGAWVEQSHTMDDLPDEVDIVYTTRWQTTGTQKADPAWRDDFVPFRVDERLMARYPDAVFMHDLPAHRGEEVTGEVLDGPASIAFPQAEMKMWSAMAVLEWALSP